MNTSCAQAAPANRVRGPLAGRLAGPTVVGLVALLLVVGATPPSTPWALAAQGAIAIGLAVLALPAVFQAPARIALRRSEPAVDARLLNDAEGSAR